MDGAGNGASDAGSGRVAYHALHPHLSEHAQTCLPRRRHRQGCHLHQVPVAQHHLPLF